MNEQMNERTNERTNKQNTFIKYYDFDITKSQVIRIPVSGCE